MRLALTMTLVACAAPEPTPEPEPVLPVPYNDPEVSGPYSVGIRTLTLRGVAGYEEVVVEVWYPTSQPSAQKTTYDFIGMPFDAQGYRDAPPDPTAPNLPCAFSHGYGGARVQNYTMAEQLASHGYIVVAPDHPGTTTLDFLSGDLGAALVRRPSTISAAVDALYDGAIPDLRPTGDRFAMIGHSLGAWTALAVGGGLLSSEAYEAACEPDDRPMGCDIIGDITYSEEDVATYGQPDPRVATTVLQSPGGFYSYDAESLGHVARPFVMGATLDDTLRYEEEAVPTFNALGSPASMATFEGAGHYGYTNMCDLSIAALFATDCTGAEGGYRDPLEVRAITTAYVVAWLGLTLGEQPEYDAWLTARDGVGWDEK